MTLEEVGALLGISDNCVMRTERAAVDRLRRLAITMRASNASDVIRSDDDALERAIAHVRANCCEYTAKYSWFELGRAHSLNGGSSDVREAIVAYNLLCMGRSSRFRVPLFVRCHTQHRHEHVGEVESFAMVGNRGMFWSRSWKGWLKRHTKTPANAVVILESERGSDPEGSFDVPLIAAVLATSDAKTTPALPTGKSVPRN